MIREAGSDLDLRQVRAVCVGGQGPTLVLVDPEGYVVAQMSGEGHAHGLSVLLEELVAEHDAKGTLRRGGPAYAPPRHHDADRDRDQQPRARLGPRVPVDQPGHDEQHDDEAEGDQQVPGDPRGGHLRTRRRRCRARSR